MGREDTFVGEVTGMVFVMGFRSLQAFGIMVSVMQGRGEGEGVLSVDGP